jgi:outer membrane protein
MIRLMTPRNTLIALSLFAGSATLSAQGGATAGTRIGYVAVRAVLQQTPGYAQADSTWKREVEGFRAEVAGMQASFDSAQAKFAEASVMMSAANRATERKKLEDQAAALQTRASALQQRSIDRERELLDPIEARVMAVIEGLRAEGNYAMIFDVSAQGSTIVTADKALDLTPRVLERLRQQGAGSGAPGND